MKKLSIIALLGLTTVSSAFADTDSVTMSFSSENPPVCTLVVTKDEADLVFDDIELSNTDNWAKATITSNTDSRIKIDLNGSWDDTDAYGGLNPDVTMHTGFDGVAGSGDDFTGHSGSVTHQASAGEPSYFELAVQAPPMTHAGEAEYEVVVQVNCM